MKLRNYLIDLFKNFDGDKNSEFINKYPKIWNDCYDIIEDSRHHDALVNSALAGFDACEAEYLKIIEKLESALKATKHDYWFMISLIERTTDDKYLKDVVSDCVYRMKFRQSMFDYALEELEEFKKKMNGDN